MINPFPHIGTFWRLCSRRLFENIVTKEEIAQNKIFNFLIKYVQIRLLQICCMRERVQEWHEPIHDIICRRQTWKTWKLFINYWIKLIQSWQIKKLLNMSHFFFCHNVFNSVLLQRHQKASTHGTGLTTIITALLW